jgi:hypothetical protein
MASVFDEIDAKLRAWIAAQPMYFVATAPLSADGHVNASPKGMDGTFVVLGPHEVAYLDYFGSGIETVAHLRENGRIVVMFCAFDGAPRVVRLHGRGHALHPGDDGFSALRSKFPKTREKGVRSIIVIDVERISDSCGFGVPVMDVVGERDLLRQGAERRGPEGLAAYRAEKNAVSVDGLPGLP